MANKPRARLQEPVVARAVKHLPHQSARWTLASQIPIPKEEIYPGRHVLLEKPKKASIMEKLQSIAMTEGQSNPGPAKKKGKPRKSRQKRRRKPVRASPKCTESIEILKQYPDPDEALLREWGYDVPSPRYRYIRHRKVMDHQQILRLQGRTKRRKRRRTWEIPFDELEHQLNRLVYGKSLLHPALGHMSFDQYSLIIAQVWNDYEICDFSDYFTLARLLTYLREDLVSMIPEYVILHDYAEYKTYEPPGVEGAFDLVYEEILNPPPKPPKELPQQQEREPTETKVEETCIG